MLRLEYILTSGAQYFDSGYVPTANTVVEVEYCEDPSGAASSTYCLFGTGTSNTDSDGTNFSFFNNVSGSTKVRTYGNYYTIPAATLSPYRRTKLQVDIQGAREIYYVQEGTPYLYTSKSIPLITFEPPASPSTISKSLFFGAQNNNGTPNYYTNSRFYNITILEEDNAGQVIIKKKYIPVLRGTVAGFYEEVEKKFIPSTASTPFKAGPILYPYGTVSTDSSDTVHTFTNLITSNNLGNTTPYSVSGNPITYTSSNSTLGATAKWNLIQVGSGEPSPTNIRNFLVKNQVSFTRSGKNLCSYTATLTFTADVRKEIISKEQMSAMLKAYRGKKMTLSYTLETKNVVWNSSNTLKRVGFECKSYNANTNEIYYGPSMGWTGANDSSFLATGTRRVISTVQWPDEFFKVEKQGAFFFYIQGLSSGTITVTNIQLEVGDTATAYTAYAGESKTLSFTKYYAEGYVDTTGVGRGTYRAIILDGKTNKFTADSSNHFWGLPNNSTPGNIKDMSCFCSHFPARFFGSNAISDFHYTTSTRASEFSFSTCDELNAFLVAQNTAGTPVWLVYKLRNQDALTVTGTGTFSSANTSNTYISDADSLTLNDIKTVSGTNWTANSNISISMVKSGGANPTNLFSDETNEDSIGYIKGTNTSEASLKFTGVNSIANHTYFFSVYVYQRANLCRMRAYWNTNYFGNAVSSAYLEHSPIARPGEWVRFSGRKQITTAITGNLNIGFVGYGTNPNVNGKIKTNRDAWITGAMLVDLTATFGAGNEPTNEWCERNLPFFKGSFTYENWLPKFKATYNGVSKWYPTYRAYKKVDGTWVLWANINKEAVIRGEVDNLRQQLMLNPSQKEMICGPLNLNFNAGKHELLVSNGGVLKKDDAGDCAYYFKGLGSIKGSSVDFDSDNFLIHWKERPENTASNFIFTNSAPVTPSNTAGYGDGGLMLGNTVSNIPYMYASTSNNHNYNILNKVQMAPTRTANTWYDMVLVRRGGKYYIYQNNSLIYYGAFSREIGYQTYLPSSIGRLTDNESSAGNYYVGYIKDFYIKRKNYDLLFPYPDDSLKDKTNLLLAAPVWGTYLTQTNNPVSINNTMIEYTSGTGEKVFSCNAAGTSFIVTHSDIGNFSTGDFAILWEEYIRSTESYDTAGIAFSDTSGYNMILSYQDTRGSDKLLLYASSNGSSWDKISSAEMGNRILDKWVKRAVIRKGTNLYCFQNDVLYSIIPKAETLKIGNNSIMFGGISWAHPANRLFRNIQIYKGSGTLKGVTIPQQAPATQKYNNSSDLLINLPLSEARDEGPNHFEIMNNGVTFNTNVSLNGKPVAYFDGNSYLSFSYIVGEEISSGDLTVEWWEYPLSGSKCRFSSIGTSSVASGLLLGYNGTQLYAGGASNSWNIVNGATAFSNTLNSWTHWAVVRQNNVFKTYRNGALFYTGATNTTSLYWNNTYNCAIGQYRTGDTNRFKGYIANFKIYRSCKYSSDFVPSST